MDNQDMELIDGFTSVIKPLGNKRIKKLFDLIAFLGEGLPKDSQLMDSPNWSTLSEAEKIFAQEVLLKLSPYTKALRDLPMINQQKIMKKTIENIYGQQEAL